MALVYSSMAFDAGSAVGIPGAESETGSFRVAFTFLSTSLAVLVAATAAATVASILGAGATLLPQPTADSTKTKKAI